LLRLTWARQSDTSMVSVATSLAATLFLATHLSADATPSMGADVTSSGPVRASLVATALALATLSAMSHEPPASSPGAAPRAPGAAAATGLVLLLGGLVAGATKLCSPSISVARALGVGGTVVLPLLAAPLIGRAAG